MNYCDCGFPLIVRYNLDLARESTSPQNISFRAPNMWRYHELLPVLDPKHILSLGEGFTPLLHLKNFQKRLGLTHLYLKNEDSNPGGTFKARGASCGLSKAKELGASKIAIATNGNAGEAWAMYAASAGIPITVIMPVDAQEITKMLCSSVGAHTLLIEGMISDAGKYIELHKKEKGWFDVSTLKEPYRLEGKKTITLEIIEQLDWSFPDVMVFPTGGGIAIAAAYKACQELQELGWVQGKLPRLIAIQASGCAPLVKAYQKKASHAEFFQGAHTKSNGLRVPKPFCDFMVLDAIYSTHGAAIAVTDEEMIEGLKVIAKTEGLYLCPEAGACIVGISKLIEQKLVSPNEKIVLMGSGSGFKYKDLIATPKLEVIHAPK